MAKKFVLGDIIGIEGKPLKTPVLDEDGRAIEDSKGRAKLKEATLADVGHELLRYFPKEALSMENITHGVRFKNQLMACKDGTLILEDAEYKWFDKMLKDETIGVRIYGFNLLAIQDAVDDFERLHQPKAKNVKKGKQDTEPEAEDKGDET